MLVDRTTYDKADRYAPGHGYEVRKAAPTSVVVHSTSNPHQKNTPFASEASFLYRASLVSAHYLVGKDGAIVQFLDPLKWAAWHAGNTLAEWTNQKSIGIELHHSVGDPPYPMVQLDTLAELLRLLMAQFTIPVDKIETHGQIAIAGPYKRKSDPSDMSYQTFLRFRSALVSAPPAVLHTVTAGPHGALAQEDRRPGALTARYYPPGSKIVCDDLQLSYWHCADHSGFIPLGQVQA